VDAITAQAQNVVLAINSRGWIHSSVVQTPSASQVGALSDERVVSSNDLVRQQLRSREQAKPSMPVIISTGSDSSSLKFETRGQGIGSPALADLGSPIQSECAPQLQLFCDACVRGFI
jgi:hypothetical protein